MHKKLLHVLALTILVASTLIGCSGGGTPCSLTPTILSITGGEVFIMKGDTDDWVAAEAEMELEVGDAMKTGNSSGADITFFDGCTIELEAETEIKILSLDIVCSTGVTTITLEQMIGTTISRVTQILDPASSYEVETSSGVAGVRGSTMIVRVMEDGTTFVTNEEGTVYARAQGEEVQVPVGQTYIINPGQPPLSSGALVPAFGTDGAVTSNPSTGSDFVSAIAIDSTAMYVVGYDYSPGNYQWRIEKRSLTDGSLVPGFGTGGVVTSDNSTNTDMAWDIAIDSTAIYVVGGDSSLGNAQWRIEKRSLTDGSPDPEFGAGGVVTSNPGSGSDYARAIAIDSTAMYVVGDDSSLGNAQWRIEKRSLTSGNLDPEFGTSGVVTSNPGSGTDLAEAIAIDSTAMYVVGYDSSPGNNQWRIEKRSLTDGYLVSEFGTYGVVTVNPGSGSDLARGITIDSTAIYVVGWDSSSGNNQWRIEKRSLTDGSLASGFGTGGVVTVNPSTGGDHAYSIAIDSTAIYVVGDDYSPGNPQWRIEKRSLTDGSLASGFGTGGVVTSNPSTFSDGTTDIAIDSTAMYVVGTDYSPGNTQWRIEKRVK
jgi:hypothetical protein